MDPYSKNYEIRWSDIDANGHVNYAAYIDAAGDLRYHFFTAHGFPPERFEQLGVGPIYTAIHASFLREVRMGETVTITYALAGLSPQGGALEGSSRCAQIQREKGSQNRPRRRHPEPINPQAGFSNPGITAGFQFGPAHKSL